MNARTAEIAGILKLKLYHMENIKMFRPKYYKELRKRNKETQPELKSSVSNSDQVISKANSTRGLSCVHPGPGLQQVIEETVPHNDIEEATSNKLQAPSVKPQAPEASSGKRQALRCKRQA